MPYFIALIIGINTAAVAVAVLAATGEYPRPLSRAFQIFGWGKVISALGYVLISQRQTLPEFFSVVMADVCIVFGFFSSYWAVRHIQGKSTAAAHSIAIIASSLLLFSYWTYVQPNLAALRILSSLYGIYISALMTWELLVRFRGYGRGHIVAGFATMLIGLMLILRAILSWHGPAQEKVAQLSGDWMETAFFILATVAGTIGAVNYMLVSNDILNGELRQLVHLDPLTGIANRRRLFERGQEEMRRAQRFRHSLALLVFDLDHFKRINDSWGHGTGDEALKAMAMRSLGVIRAVDTLARLGGEEFAVLLPEADAAMALDVAERLRITIAETVLTGTKPDGAPATPLWITVSIGVAVMHEEGTFSALLDHADQAMYQAKRNGRNQVALYSALTLDTMAEACDRPPMEADRHSA